MKIAINYSDENYVKQQKLNTKTAYKNGKFDKVIEYSPKDLDFKFIKKNEQILANKKGGGYWLWKPYIILNTLNKINEGDFLFYCDSGSYYVSPIDNLIKVMEEKKKSIMLFENPLVEKQWTRRDTFIIMGCDDVKYTDTPQLVGGFILLKKDKFSVNFIKEYLSWCCDKSCIMDFDQYIYKSNYENFIAHRHDQSILSILGKKYDIETFRDPSQFGDRQWQYFSEGRDLKLKKFKNSTYPRLVMLYRGSSLVRFNIKEGFKDFLTYIGIDPIKFSKYYKKREVHKKN